MSHGIARSAAAICLAIVLTSLPMLTATVHAGPEWLEDKSSRDGWRRQIDRRICSKARSLGS